MHLQLAEGKRKFRYGGFAERKHKFNRINSELLDDANPFIYVPDPSGQSRGVFVREDHFDSLTPFEWRQLMVQLAPHQPEVEDGTMSEGNFMNDRASRKARREERKQNRTEKKELKNKKREAKNEILKARAVAKKEGRGADVLGSVIDGVKSIFGKGETESEYDTTTTNTPRPKAPAPPEDEDSEGIFSTKNLLIAGGLALAGGVLYYTVRNK
jgi:hypothetical protein